MSSKQMLFEDIFALLPAHVYQKNTSGVYIKCSALQAKVFGYQTGKDVVGKTDYDLLDKNQADHVRANDLKAMQMGKTLTVEERVVLPNGAEVVYLSKKVPLFDDDGESVGILGISTDITEEKRRNTCELLELQSGVEKKKENIKSYYEHLIALMPGNVYWMDRSNVFLGCNDKQAKLAGLKSRQEIIGKTNYDMPWKEQADELNALNNKVMETGVPYVQEEIAEMLFGDTVKTGVFLSQKIPLFDNVGTVVGLLGISIDITERKKAEELAVKNKQLTAEKLALTEAFTGFMAHELRTPIASLNTVLDTIEGNEKTPDPAKRQETLEQIIARGKQTVRGANSFIDMLLYKLRNMSKEVKKEELDLCLILDDVADALSDYPFTEVENTQFTLEKKNAFVYYGNSLHTKHIIFNLLKNALKIIAEEQKGHITISFEQSEGKGEDEGEDCNKLIFTDTAKGIAPEFLPTIFDAFITKDDTKKGTGLGLAYCKLVMQGYGGDIACESKLGEYTRFVCIFPKIKIDEL